MKRLYLLAVAFSLYIAPAMADVLPPVKYPPGTPLTAIAVNEQVRLEIAGKPGVEYCLWIDTRSPVGACLHKINLNAGGGNAAGASGAGSGNGGPGF